MTESNSQSTAKKPESNRQLPTNIPVPQSCEPFPVPLCLWCAQNLPHNHHLLFSFQVFISTTQQPALKTLGYMGSNCCSGIHWSHGSPSLGSLLWLVHFGSWQLLTPGGAPLLVNKGATYSTHFAGVPSYTLMYFE